MERTRAYNVMVDARFRDVLFAVSRLTRKRVPEIVTEALLQRLGVTREQLEARPTTRNGRLPPLDAPLEPRVTGRDLEPLLKGRPILKQDASARQDEGVKH